MLKLSGCSRLTWGRFVGTLASGSLAPRRRGSPTAVQGASASNHRVPWLPSPRGCYLGQPRAGAHGRPISATPPIPFTGGRGGCWRRCVTPRQACPRPDGFGRNLRSKTRWFTGFCNSHQVSHFATFFIDARAEISVAESRFICNMDDDASPFQTVSRRRGRTSLFGSLAQFAPGFVVPVWGEGLWSPTSPPPLGLRATDPESRSPAFVFTCSRVVLPCRFRQ